MVALLFFSQVVLFPSGTDVSPYAATMGGAVPRTIAGATLQVWALAGVFVVVSLGGMHAIVGSPNPFGIVVALFYILGRALLAPSPMAESLESAGKLLLPVLIFFYLIDSDHSGAFNKSIESFLLLAQIFLLGQIVLAKVITGSFGPNRYYYELHQEYFGYFYHPFALAGTLGLLALFASSQILMGRRVVLYALLTASSSLVILLLQVRTYIYATVVGLVVLVAVDGFRRRRFGALGFALPGMAFVVTRVLLDYAGSGRVTGDYSSGRVERWIADVGAVTGSGSPILLILGGGPQRVYSLNYELFGIRINSLNLAVDLFVDFGLLGVISYLYIWYVVFVKAMRSVGRTRTLSVGAFLIVASMLTSPLEFPAVGVTAAIVLGSSGLKSIEEGELDEGLSAASTAVS